MSYTPTEWNSGDVITAEKLNNIESGISNTRLIVEEALNGSLNKTWKEIYNALTANIPVFIKPNDGLGVTMCPVTAADSQSGLYAVGCIVINIFDYSVASIIYTTDSENGYPINPIGSIGQ